MRVNAESLSAFLKKSSRVKNSVQINVVVEDLSAHVQASFKLGLVCEVEWLLESTNIPKVRNESADFFSKHAKHNTSDKPDKPGFRTRPIPIRIPVQNPDR